MDAFQDKSTLLGEADPIQQEETEIQVGTNPWQQLMDTSPQAISVLMLNPAYLLLKAELSKTYEALKEELVFAEVKDSQILQGNAQAYAAILHTIKELETLGK